MTTIVIQSLAQLKALSQKFKVLSVIFPTLQIQAAERAADEAILGDIHRDMETNEFSKKIIDRTFVGPIEQLNNGKTLKIHFISDFVSDSGFDVSKGREEGTTDHDVFPIPPNQWLTYIDQNTGKRVFRRHTHPSGIERLLLIETNINKNKQAFMDSYENQIVQSARQVVTV